MFDNVPIPTQCLERKKLKNHNQFTCSCAVQLESMMKFVFYSAPIMLSQFQNFIQMLSFLIYTFTAKHRHIMYSIRWLKANKTEIRTPLSVSNEFSETSDKSVITPLCFFFIVLMKFPFFQWLFSGTNCFHLINHLHGLDNWMCKSFDLPLHYSIGQLLFTAHYGAKKHKILKLISNQRCAI